MHIDWMDGKGNIEMMREHLHIGGVPGMDMDG